MFTGCRKIQLAGDPKELLDRFVSAFAVNFVNMLLDTNFTLG